MNITLPWPPRSLHPNSRVHWAVRAKAAKKARTDASVLTLGALCVRPRPDFGPTVYVRMTFCPPDNRRRDLDGMLSASKNLLDGVADALGVNDNRFSLTLERGPVKKGGAVLVQVYA